MTSNFTSQKLQIFSSFAVDTIKDEAGAVIDCRPGGPAQFIEVALDRAQVPYQLSVGAPIDVEILVTPDGEFGRVPLQPVQRKITGMRADAWVLVSTILDEWELTNLLAARLFVDIQGYVRDGKDFGKKRTNRRLNEAAGRIYCLKGTREEINCIPVSVLEAQKSKLLIITDGEKGVEIFFEGERAYMPVQVVADPPDTIGAGDTFFAYFVAKMFKGDCPFDAATYAVQQTSRFLNTKKSPVKVRGMNI